MKTKIHILTAITFTGLSHLASAATASYYVGVDGLQTIASGAYAGMANPNYNRLTLLFAHFESNPSSNHYHSKGVQIYSGPAGSPTVITSSSNYLPEGSNPPLVLSVASGGLYDGKLSSHPVSGNAFSDLTLQDTGKLDGFAAGSGESYMFNSSGGRWNGALTGADVHLQLVSLTAGLNVGTSTTLNLFSNPGDEHHLDESFSFNPVFWTDANAAPGDYIARFKLTDESGTFGDSGTFEYRFQVVPEPSSLLTACLGGLVLLRRKR